MARFAANQADNYGGQGGGGFFRLPNDGDVATIRFMYNGIGDVVGDSVHQIETPGKDGRPKKKYVNCLRAYNEPVDTCPFCKAGKPVQAKLFIPIYNIDSGQTQTWERGKTFFSKMSSTCARFSGEGNPLVSHIFEIERQGKANDTRTDYGIYEVDRDETTLEDLPEPANLNGYLLDKSAEEMEQYLQTGSFGDEEPVKEDREMPIRRRERATDDNNDGAIRRRRREAF